MGRRQPEWRQGKRTTETRTARVCLAVLPLVVASLVLLGATGCEDSARKPVAAYHPLPIPATVRPNLDVPLNSAYWPFAPPVVTAPEDGVGLLAAQAQGIFQVGVEDFQKGDLSGARQEFDDALGVLQQSGFDVQAEPQLAQVFRRIVETAHSDENIAAQQATGTGQPGEAAADQFGVGFSPEGIPEGPVDPGLRTSAEGEVEDLQHDLPLTVNDSVLAFLNFFTKTPKGRAVVENGLRRAGRYRPMIQRVLHEEGLPSDLIYMAQAESAFQPQALSSAGARGLWQFMSFRGQEYGLEHSWWVDDRQDPEKATRAAAHHLRDLYDMFGDWYLAMAAYDSGPGNVQRAVERTGYADFWELYHRNVLPKETQNYVPIILALTLIGKDPSRYGIDVEPEEPLRTDTVVLDHPIDLRLVADTVGVDVDTLKSLNPQLLRLATPADTRFSLHLPEGTADEFTADIADIPPDKWLSWRLHKVAPGETLSAIALKYHVTAAAIEDVNGLDAGEPLDAESRLVIPVSVQVANGPGKLVHYRVRLGDTMDSVADEFDVTPADLKRWNRLRSTHIVRGMRLTIYPGGAAPPSVSASAPHPQTVAARAASKPAPTKAAAAVETTAEVHSGTRSEVRGEVGREPAAGEKPIVHRVAPGETLWSIAQSYKTTVASLRAGNKFLLTRPLQAGDTLTILPPR